jgi:hypothetical protein
MTEKTVNLEEQIEGDLLQSMREGKPDGLSGVPYRKPQVNDAIPKIAP